MKVEDMTKNDFVKALKEIEIYEATATIPSGIVSDVALTLTNGQRWDIHNAINSVCREALNKYVKKYKPITTPSCFPNQKEILCCGNCNHTFILGCPTKFCFFCGAETDYDELKFYE